MILSPLGPARLPDLTHFHGDSGGPGSDRGRFGARALPPKQARRRLQVEY